MIRGIWGDPDRYVDSYFKQVKKDGKSVYFSGDGAIIDEKGYITITGRTDDVVNVSGHRIGTAEIEFAIAKHPSVAESACVSRLDLSRVRVCLLISCCMKVWWIIPLRA